MAARIATMFVLLGFMHANRVLGAQQYTSAIGDKWVLASSVKMNYENAQKFCADNHGVLIRPASAEEINGFKRIIEDNGFVEENGMGSAYTGLNDIDNEGTWVYSDSTSNNGGDATFFNWHTGEPNGNRGENCVVLAAHKDYTMNDITCNDERRVLCEYAPPY